MLQNKQILACATAIATTIAGYLLFNYVVGQSSVLMLGFINLAGSLGTTLLFRKEVFYRNEDRKLRVRTPEWKVALLGGIGIVCIAVGLKFGQSYLGIFVAMQFIYDAFVVTNAILDLAAEWKRQGHISSLPLNIILHGIMAAIVSLHILLHWHWSASYFLIATLFVTVAVTGYRLFNRSLSSVKDLEKRRVTNVTMNIGGGIGLIAVSPLFQSALIPSDILKILAGGLALVIIVSSLGRAYQLFKPFNLMYLVPVFVYDGLLVTPSLLQIVTNLHSSVLVIDLLLTAGMVCIMILRSPQLQRKIVNIIPIKAH